MQWFSVGWGGGDSALWGPPGNVWEHLWLRSGEGVLLASSGGGGQGYCGKHPTVPVTATCNKESVLPRLRNPFLKVKTEGSMCVRWKILAET